MTTRQRSVLIGVLAGLVISALAIVALVVLNRSGGADDQVVQLGPDRIPTAQDVAGKQVPTDDFTYFDGTKGSFADYAGKPLVVNFFAEWCAPCVKELPDFESVHQQLGDSVAFLGLNTNDIDSRGRALAKRAGITYDLASDPVGDFLAALGGIRMPATVFVSPEGRIVETKLGGLTAAELTEKLRQHFPQAVS